MYPVSLPTKSSSRPWRPEPPTPRSASSIDAIYEGFARDSETNELDPEMLACMQETAPVAEFRAAMVTSFTGDDDAALIAVGKKWEACS